MIDEVDKTSNNRIFIHFLGMLRDKFLARKNGEDHTFHSVILAGVHDIKNIKLKMTTEGSYTPAPEENKVYNSGTALQAVLSCNSPWNIAVSFRVDMSFNPAEIAAMLTDYETDHCADMDIPAISEAIHTCTGGYPFLVSRICQCLDEELDRNWTPAGVQKAVNVILDEKNTLFDDIFKNLETWKELYDFVYSVLITGEQRAFVIHDPLIELGVMFGFLKNSNGKVAIANRIFEIAMSNY